MIKSGRIAVRHSLQQTKLCISVPLLSGCGAGREQSLEQFIAQLVQLHRSACIVNRELQRRFILFGRTAMSILVSSCNMLKIYSDSTLVIEMSLSLQGIGVQLESTYTHIGCRADIDSIADV